MVKKNKIDFYILYWGIIGLYLIIVFYVLFGFFFMFWIGDIEIGLIDDYYCCFI